MSLGFRFREVMEGTARRPGEREDRRFRFELDVSSDRALGLFEDPLGDLAEFELDAELVAAKAKLNASIAQVAVKQAGAKQGGTR